MGRGLLDVHVLAGLEPPDRGERVPVVRRRDDDGVDVLVFEHAPHVLNESRLVVGDVLQPGVVDAFRREVGVDVAQGLDADVRQLREPALDGVPLSADADAGDDDAIVGAENAPLRRCAETGAEEITTHRQAGGCRAESRCKVPPRDAVLIMPVVGHVDLLLTLLDLPLLDSGARFETAKGRSKKAAAS